MPMTLIVVLNLVMSLLAVGAVATGVLIARALQPASADEGGRADRRGPSDHGRDRRAGSGLGVVYPLGGAAEDRCALAGVRH